MTNDQSTAELMGQTTEFKVGNNEQQIQKMKGRKKQPASSTTAMVIAKAGGTLKSGLIRAFLSPVMGTTEVIAESMKDFIEGN
jgi:hypothetical protein